LFIGVTGIYVVLEIGCAGLSIEPLSYSLHLAILLSSN
jgi:hypothetical protein